MTDLADDLAAVPYTRIPYIERRWQWENYIPLGNPVLFAAAGGTGKGMLMCAAAARVALGLPFPGEDQDIRREPGRVVYVAGTEDDQFEDLAPRFRAAIGAAVAEFGLNPELAGESGAIGLIHDLSEWRDGSPFEVPADMGRLANEVGKLNALGGPKVAMVVLDPLADLLGQHDTIATVKGARRVLKPVKQFARMCDVAVPIVHHLTKDGKVSGSPAVVDALRLAFVITRDPVDENVRVITSAKSNISTGEPARYAITGAGHLAHAVFTDARDVHAERVARASEQGAPAAEPPAGSVRARMAAVGQCRHPSRRGTPAQCGDCPAAGAAPAGPGFRLVRSVQSPGGAPGRPETVRGGPFATRAAARAAATADAGAVLAWSPAPRMPEGEAAAIERADGTRLAYLTSPVRAPVPSPQVPA